MASTVTKLQRGENRLISRKFRQVGGVALLPISSLASAQVELIQDGAVVHTYVLTGNPQLRAGAAINELVLELTSAVTAALKPVALTLRWELRVQDPLFVVEPNVFIDRITETPVTFAE